MKTADIIAEKSAEIRDLEEYVKFRQAKSIKLARNLRDAWLQKSKIDVTKFATWQELHDALNKAGWQILTNDSMRLFDKVNFGDFSENVVIPNYKLPDCLEEIGKYPKIDYESLKMVEKDKGFNLFQSFADGIVNIFRGNKTKEEDDGVTPEDVKYEVVEHNDPPVVVKENSFNTSSAVETQSGVEMVFEEDGPPPSEPKRPINVERTNTEMTVLKPHSGPRPATSSKNIFLEEALKEPATKKLAKAVLAVDWEDKNIAEDDIVNAMNLFNRLYSDIGTSTASNGKPAYLAGPKFVKLVMSGELNKMITDCRTTLESAE
jgi:hypothetical protein